MFIHASSLMADSSLDFLVQCIMDDSKVRQDMTTTSLRLRIIMLCMSSYMLMGVLYT